MNNNDIIKQSFKTIKEMLVDRKINIDNIDNITEEELFILNDDSLIFDIKVNETYKIIYYMYSKIKIADIENYISENDKNILFISKELLTTNNYKTFNNSKKIIDNKINIQFFYINELLYNIYHHELVPKHEPITDDKEMKKIMDKYLLKNMYQFPLILKDDPICKYLDIKQNTLVKITRPSKTSGEYILYRYCV